MAICKFWSRGACKFGNECRFEHPPGVGPHGQDQGRHHQQPQRQQQPSQPQNRFGLFGRVNDQNSSTSRSPRHQSEGLPQGRLAPPPSPPRQRSRDARGPNIRDSYGVTADLLEDDLRERPLWLMSAYGPGKFPPVQLFGGPQLEQSPEEIRTLHYMALASGTPEHSAQLEAELAGRANQQLQMVMGDMKGALEYLREGEKQHPNRKDICRKGTTSKGPDGPFSRQNRRNAMRSEQGATRISHAHNSGFGQPNGPTAGLGQGGGLGENGGTGPGLQNSQPFGQQPQQTAFGQQPSGFGQPLQPQGFGGGMDQQSQGSGFGQTQQPVLQASFGPNPMQSATSGFQQQIPQKENTPFGMQASPAPAGFGGGLAQQPAGLGAFGQSASMDQQPNGFLGQHNPQQQQQQSQSPFARIDDRQNPNTNTGGSGFQRPRPDNVTNGVKQEPSLPAASGDISNYTTRDANGRLATWKGQRVQYDEESRPCYGRQDGRLERIWFPDGPPSAQKVNTMASVEYSPDMIRSYEVLRENMRFPGDSIPELPPTIDMTRWDL